VSFLRREAIGAAHRLVEQGQWADALSTLWQLADRMHVVDDDLRTVLRLMARSFHALERRRAVSTIQLFLGDLQGAWNSSEGEPLDRARVAARAGDRTGAGAQYVEAGFVGHGAFELEAGDDPKGARVLWERLAGDPQLVGQPYVAGLVRFNLGRVCERLGDSDAARRARIEAMHLLEAAADGFETQGRRERAFDCYQVLLTLGREGAFENLAEGYLNCIRILSEDNLRHYALQYYDDFQQLALERGELRAAATLFREAADFCRRHGLPYEHHYRSRAADALAEAGAETAARGGPPEVAEATYLASLDLYATLGLYSRARQVYEELTGLPLPDRRLRRYRRLRTRLATAPDESLDRVPFPEHFRQDAAYPDIWRLDVLEWERGGDAAEAMADVLIDPRWDEFEHVRRPALFCRLHDLGASDRERARSDHQVRLAGLLSLVEIYTALGPLEELFASEHPSVRAAAVKAVRQLYFKRSYEVVSAALRDPAEPVRREAIKAVATLHFPHAFDPLSRIHRDHRHRGIRRAALESIGKIKTDDAVEYLIDLVRHGDSEERVLAADLLVRSEHERTNGLLAQAAAAEVGPLRRELEAIRSRR